MKNRSLVDESFQLKGWQHQDQRCNLPQDPIQKQRLEISKVSNDKIKKHDKMMPTKYFKSPRSLKLSASFNIATHNDSHQYHTTIINKNKFQKDDQSIQENEKNKIEARGSFIINEDGNSQIKQMTITKQQHLENKQQSFHFNESKILINTLKLNKNHHQTRASQTFNQPSSSLKRQDERLKYFTNDLQSVKKKQRKKMNFYIKNKYKIMQNKSDIKDIEKMNIKYNKSQNEFVYYDQHNKTITSTIQEANMKNINKIYQKIRLKNKYLQQLKTQSKKFYNFPLFYLESQLKIKQNHKLRNKLNKVSKSQSKTPQQLTIKQIYVKQRQFIDDNIFSNQFICL